MPRSNIYAFFGSDILLALEQTWQMNISCRNSVMILLLCGSKTLHWINHPPEKDVDSMAREVLNYISQRFFINRYDKTEVKSPTKIKYDHSREKLDILPPSKRIALIGS